MMFSDSQISELIEKIRPRLSEKRYIHTLGVRDAAVKIASFFGDIDISEISAAALLHDITKEYSLAEQKNMLLSHEKSISEDNLRSEAVLHSLTAPYAVISDFSTYATENVLSAVRYHTLGDKKMSIFDEIVFLADYVEDGRMYQSCIDVRLTLYKALQKATSERECLSALHTATVAALSYTVSSLEKRRAPIHPKTIATLNAFKSKL